MRVVMQVLAPGVEDCDATDLGTEMPGVGGDGAQRLGGCTEQDGVDRRLVLEGDSRDLGRQSEHNMEIGYRQELGLPVGEPLGASETLAFRTMAIAAGFIGAAHQAAVLAIFGEPAERRGPAHGDGAQNAALVRPRWPARAWQ
jgi:hypothetical protein